MNSKIRVARMLGTVIALASTVLLAAVANGCVAGSGQGEDGTVDVADGKLQPQIAPGGPGGECCEFGSWTCAKAKSPNDATEFVYWPPGTCGNTEPDAEAVCADLCAVACVNRGWTDNC